MALAAMTMGVCVFVAASLLAPWLAAGPIVRRGTILMVLVGLGVGLFAVVCQLAGVVDFRRLLRRT